MSSFAFTMEGAAAGMDATGLSMKGVMLSGLGHTACPLSTAATFAAARVACDGGNKAKQKVGCEWSCMRKGACKRGAGHPYNEPMQKKGRTQLTMPERVHSEAEAMWGTMTALGQSASPGFMAGSSSNTSSPHLGAGGAQDSAAHW